jgi:hypothetical protein
MHVGDASFLKCGDHEALRIAVPRHRAAVVSLQGLGELADHRHGIKRRPHLERHVKHRLVALTVRNAKCEAVFTARARIAKSDVLRAGDIGSLLPAALDTVDHLVAVDKGCNVGPKLAAKLRRSRLRIVQVGLRDHLGG